MKFSFVFIINILIFINKTKAALIIFPIKQTNKKSNSSYDFMSTLYSNELYTNLKIGSFNQKIIPIIISREEVAFTISQNSYDIKSSPNFDESKSYPSGFAWENINSGILFEETLFINMTNTTENNIIKEKNFSAKFISVENQTYNYIGLNFPDLYQHNVVSIFKTLKDNKLIENYEWFIKLNKKNSNDNFFDWFNIEGEIIFGGNCHDYLPKQFEKNYITEYEMFSHGQYVEYSIKFTNIYVGDEQINNNLYYNQIFFDLKFLTIGSLEYETKISNLFFNDWIPKNICFVEIMNMYPDIHYYYCNINLDKEKKFDIKSFPSLCMKEKTISNNTFCFNYNDLFVEDPNNKNVFYFMIVFKKFDPINDSSKYFHFGLQFLSKYQLSFDPKDKKIKYFGKSEQIKEKEEKNSSSSSSFYFQAIVIIIVLAIILFVLGMLFQKQISKLPRKNRANELLDDNFEYEQKNIN